MKSAISLWCCLSLYVNVIQMHIKDNLLLDQLLKIFLHWYKLNTFIFVTANETVLMLFVQNDHISIRHEE